MNDQDWHPADIVAGIKKKGTTMAAISRSAGLASSTLANMLTRHWPKGERLIADVIGKRPEEIWPSRYQMKKDKQASVAAPEGHNTAT
ncbi:helix-turn-helix domain-containing protein [Sodalis ligni]|uniref:Nlp family transcriptional regulator n=1 Tax=Sodalis ligni TaxID=2697027 RepID=A0A4R1NH07_9GAMM|nr:helix-turn-helix transcriptional regulator [Sodalis ligni]TCL07004.1 Nlp family transcriptional regulator [Sodalis ligni]